MRLQHIKAAALPLGNRVNIYWLNPEPETYTGVRVMRRENTHPVLPRDGVLVAEKENKPRLTLELKRGSELDNRTVSPKLRDRFTHQRINISERAAVSVIRPGEKWQLTDGDDIYIIVKNEKEKRLTVYGISGVLDWDLQSETVYYYSLFPYQGEPSDRKYLNNRFNRISVMATGSYGFSDYMYQLLPAIYHRYDTRLPYYQKNKVLHEEGIRGQLRLFLTLPGTQLDQFTSFAAAVMDFQDIHRVDGQLLPLLAQWIGWETSFSSEIAGLRNDIRYAPHIYTTVGRTSTLEAMIKRVVGWDFRIKHFDHNTFVANRPRRLNLWLSQRIPGGKWKKSREVFSLDFAYEGRPAAARDKNDVPWLFYHTRRNECWDIWYKTYAGNGKWTPSQPLNRSTSIDKHPTVILRDQKLLVFWNSYSPVDRTWRILYREQEEKEHMKWSGIKTFDHGMPGKGTQRKCPFAVADHNKQTWLFWLESTSTAAPWQLKINRKNNNGWELDPAADFPTDNGNDPRVEADLFVLLRTIASGSSLLVFWARKKTIKPSPGKPARTCWEIAFREKKGPGNIDGGWGPIRVLPKAPGQDQYDDREPAAIIHEGNIEISWASNRTGKWAIWNMKLKTIASANLDNAEMIPENPYSQRTPLPLLIEKRMSLVYRSNRCIERKEDPGKTLQNFDFRYSGCITAEQRNKARNKWQGKYEEFQTYTCDTGKNGKRDRDDLYAPDTIGLYLEPNTKNKHTIKRGKETIQRILKRFLPVQDRAVLFIDNK